MLALKLCVDDGSILDNLPARDSANGRTTTIEATGATLGFLPPSSLDFQAIENALAELKVILRQAAARTLDTSGISSTTHSQAISQSDAPTTSPQPRLSRNKETVV